jgi:hypothetical protein
VAAPIGNKFWELRSKHGRDKLFETPELLWEAAKEYFTYTDSRKWIKKDWVGKNAKEVFRETETPYTLSGLCLYLDCNREYFSQFKKTLMDDDVKDKDFSFIISRIEQIIYTQKIEGASVGAFNANIVSQELGLISKTQTDVNANIKSSKLQIEIVQPLDEY